MRVNWGVNARNSEFEGFHVIVTEYHTPVQINIFNACIY